MFERKFYEVVERRSDCIYVRPGSVLATVQLEATEPTELFATTV